MIWLVGTLGLPFFFLETVYRTIHGQSSRSFRRQFDLSKTLWIIQNGEKKEKSISRSSVDYALKIVMETAVSGPKQLKIYGSSYVWAIFKRFGLIHASDN